MGSDGVTMGSSLGPTLANIFLSSLETRHLDECPLEFEVGLYRRYINDTFRLLKNCEHITSLL